MKSRHFGLLKGLGVAITATSIVPTLATVSCGTNSETRFDAIGGEFDREFNLSQSTYKALKSQFVSKVRNKLSETLTKEAVELEINKINRSLLRIDDNFLSNNQYSYSLLSAMLVEKAKRQYDVNLCTNSSAQWPDVTEMFNGMKASFGSYMDSLQIDKNIRDAVLRESNNKFRLMMDGDEEANILGIRQKYDDPLVGLIHAKANLISCFDEVNTDIALISASLRLKQFMSDYTITLKDDARLDTLEKLHPEIRTKNFNLSSIADEIFTITRNLDGNIISFGNLNLPGYTIAPILTNISRNPIKNEYSLDVDWTCQKTTYQLNNTINKDKAVAHLFAGSLYVGESEDTKGKSLFDILDANNEVNPIPYSITLTPDGEKEALQSTYLDKLDFAWDQNVNNNAYESFFQGDKIETTNSTSTYRIGAGPLATSGLTISVKDATNTSSEPIRLDTIVQTTRISDLSNSEGLPQDEKGELLSNFIENCNIESLAVINENSSTEHGNHVVENSLMFSYKNTKNINDESIIALNPQDTSGFPVGKVSYQFLTEVYNNLKDDIEPYMDEYDFIRKDFEDVDNELNITICLYLFSLMITGLSVMGLLKVYRAMSYMIILILTIVSQTLQTADLIWLIVKYFKVKDYYDDICKFKNSQEVVAFNNMLDSDATGYKLLRATKDDQDELTLYLDKSKFESNYDVYKNKPWDGENGIKAILDRYQNIYKDPIYQNFVTKASESNVSPQRYKQEMRAYMPGGGYWGLSLALNGASMLCDIAAMIIVPSEDQPLKKIVDEKKTQTLVKEEVKIASGQAEVKQVSHIVDKVEPPVPPVPVQEEKVFKEVFSCPDPAMKKLYEDDFYKQINEYNHLTRSGQNMFYYAGSQEMAERTKLAVLDYAFTASPIKIHNQIVGRLYSPAETLRYAVSATEEKEVYSFADLISKEVNEYQAGYNSGKMISRKILSHDPDLKKAILFRQRSELRQLPIQFNMLYKNSVWKNTSKKLTQLRAFLVEQVDPSILLPIDRALGNFDFALNQVRLGQAGVTRYSFIQYLGRAEWSLREASEGIQLSELAQKGIRQWLDLMHRTLSSTLAKIIDETYSAMLTSGRIVLRV